MKGIESKIIPFFLEIHCIYLIMNRCHSLRVILRKVPESLEEYQDVAELSLFPIA